MAGQEPLAAGGDLHRGHAAGEDGRVVGVGVEAVGGAVVRREGVQVVAALLGERGLGDDEAGDNDRVAEVVDDGIGRDGDCVPAAGGDDLAVLDDEDGVGDGRPVAGPEPGGPVGVRLRRGGGGGEDGGKYHRGR